MTHLSAVSSVARPVAARPVTAGWKGGPVALSAGVDVLLIRTITDAGRRLSLLGQRGYLREVVSATCLFERIAMEIADILRNPRALGVVPGTFTDAVARVHRTLTLRAQVGVPGLAPAARCRREGLAVFVGARQA